MRPYTKICSALKGSGKMKKIFVFRCPECQKSGHKSLCLGAFFAPEFGLLFFQKLSFQTSPFFLLNASCVFLSFTLDLKKNGRFETTVFEKIVNQMPDSLQVRHETANFNLRTAQVKAT